MKKENYYYCIFMAIVIVIMLTFNIKKLNNEIQEINKVVQQQYKLIDSLSERKGDLLEEIYNLNSHIIDLLEMEKITLKKFIMKSNYNISKEIALEISENILYFSDKYKIPKELIIGIIYVESRFNPEAVSKARARGLMQVMPMWVSHLDFVETTNDLHKIDVGIEAGINVFLIHLQESKNDISKALYHYVGKDYKYINMVYTATAEFVVFKNSIINGKE